jgi:hypothetical protein
MVQIVSLLRWLCRFCTHSNGGAIPFMIAVCKTLWRPALVTQGSGLSPAPCVNICPLSVGLRYNEAGNAAVSLSEEFVWLVGPRLRWHVMATSCPETVPYSTWRFMLRGLYARACNSSAKD